MAEKIYKVLIVEDEKHCIDLLSEYISKHLVFKLDQTARDGVKALQILQKENFDLMFLDVQMPNMNGLDLLSKLENKPYIIFTTAHKKYAVDAFEYEAIDYLVKPISEERFNQAIDRFMARKKLGESNDLSIENSNLTFKEGRKQRLIPYDDIFFFTADDKHTVIHTAENDFEASNLLGEFANKLPSNMFTRIHKKHIINMKYFSALEYDSGWQYRVILNNDDETSLPVGKTYVASFKEILNAEAS